MSKPKMERSLWLDAVRGWCLIWICYGHARENLMVNPHPTELWSLPAFYSKFDWVFLARFIAEAAPVTFFFLLGIGIILLEKSRRKHRWSEWHITRHFLFRGMALFTAQLILMNGITYFKSGYAGSWWETSVLSTLALCLACGGIIRRLPSYGLLLLALTFFAITHFWTASLDMTKGVFPLWSHLLVIAGYTQPLIEDNRVTRVWVSYPLLPWLGITALGMIFGRLFLEKKKNLYRYSAYLGFALAAVYFTLQIFDIGDLRPRVDDSWQAFLHTTKYPPSFSFLAYTLGISLVWIPVFAWIGNQNLNRYATPLLVYGRSSFFFFVIHHFFLVVCGKIFGNQHVVFWEVASICLLVLALCYPCCLYYGRFKHTRPADSVWRFF